jgi:hypothetical protein
MNLSRARKLVDAIETLARSTEADLTAAIGMHDVAPLRKLRTAVQAFVTDTVVAQRELRELDSELTPVQVPTSKSSSGFKAVTVTEIFENANKGNPSRDEP